MEDADVVSVRLNGHTVAFGTSLLNAGREHALRYRVGRNDVEVHAHNEGPLPPNTVGLGFGDVVRGQAVRLYGLLAGERIRLIVTYDPTRANTASQGRGGAPSPSYSRCGGDGGEACAVAPP